MIELLILYSLNKRERTLYSLRADIIEKFGHFTRPSIGTIHPALKRMLACNIAAMRNDFSQGGKKSTFYGLTSTGLKHFRELFFKQFSENPTLFFTEIQSKIATISLLETGDKELFVKELLLKLELYLLDLRNTAEDEYIERDEFQKNLLHKNIEDVERYIKFVETLKSCLQ